LGKKYQLLIRMWIKQDKLYDTSKEAYEEGCKIANPKDVAVEEVEVETGKSNG